MHINVAKVTFSKKGHLITQTKMTASAKRKYQYFLVVFFRKGQTTICSQSTRKFPCSCNKHHYMANQSF